MPAKSNLALNEQNMQFHVKIEKSCTRYSDNQYNCFENLIKLLSLPILSLHVLALKHTPFYSI